MENSRAEQITRNGIIMALEIGAMSGAMEMSAVREKVNEMLTRKNLSQEDRDRLNQILMASRGDNRIL